MNNDDVTKKIFDLVEDKRKLRSQLDEKDKKIESLQKDVERYRRWLYEYPKKVDKFDHYSL